MLVLPGVIDVHTHTRVASDEEPDRFFQDSVAAAFGGTTTFLAFNNPGTGSPRTHSLIDDIRGWRAATDSDSAVDYGVSLVVTPDEQEALGELPAAVDAGVPTFKAFMVYDFGVSDAALSRLLGLAATAPRPARGPLRGSRRARVAHSRAAGCRQDRRRAITPTRGQISSRRPARTRQSGWRAPPTRRCTSSTFRVPQRSGRRSRRARGRPAGIRRDVPALPGARRVALRPAARGSVQVRHLAAAAASRPTALRCGPAWPTGRWRWWRLTTCRTASRSKSRPGASRSTRSATAGRASRRCWRSSTAKASPRAGSRVERMVDLLSTTPARLFGLNTKGAIEVGKDADLVIFDPAERRTITRGRAPPHLRLHAVRGHGGDGRRGQHARSRRVRRARRPLRRPARLRPVPGAPLGLALVS